MDALCPYCEKDKSDVKERTFSLHASSDKILYVKSCEECFSSLGEKLIDSYREYYREICSDN